MTALSLLGPARWRDAEAEGPLLPERGHQLLAWLAHTGDWAARDRLATLFWPGHEAAAARRNLRKVLFRLQPPPGLPALETRGDLLRWPVATDVAAFEHAEPAGALALWRGEPWQDLQAEALPGLADWLAAERLRLRTRWRQCVLACAAAEPARAEALLQSLLAHDPLDEEALQALLRHLLATGRRAEAQAAYRRLAEALAEALGLDPAPATRALLEATAPAAPPPPALAPLVGRRAEMQALQQLFARPGACWVTLVGAGGSGKTLLARHALAGLAEHTLFVAFDDISHADEAAPRLLQALGAARDPARPAAQQLADVLAGRDLLLGLDNLEHLPQAAQALAALPGLRVLATSRMRLGVAGEQMLALQGLPWPAPEDADRAAAFDAVQLFTARAAAQGTAAAPPADVARLCAAVEGLPLALEIAAAWTRHCSVAEIVADLERGATDLLVHPDDTAAPRHRSLQACFDHSWQLLSPREREVLARLSVLRARFSRATALAVAGAPLPVLAALLDKSLVQREGPDRHALHPLVQQFARERLAQRPVWQRAALQAAAPHHLRTLTAGQAAADAREDLLAAWQWALAERRTDLLRDSASALRLRWQAEGRPEEGERLLAAAEPLFEDDAATLALLKVERGTLLAATARRSEFDALCAQALALLRGRGPLGVRRRACLGRGYALMSLGRFAAAARWLERALALARREGGPLALGNVLASLASLNFQLGRYAAAVDLNREALALRIAAGQPQAPVLANLGAALLCDGRAAEARVVFEQGLSADDGPPGTALNLRINLAQMALDAGDAPGAQAHLAAARSQAGSGAGHLQADFDLLSARVTLALGDAEGARGQLQAAGRLVLQQQVPATALSALIAWAEWHLAAGTPAQAANALAAVLAQRELQHYERRLAERLAARAGPLPVARPPMEALAALV